MITPTQTFFKRCFDLIASAIVLILTFWIIGIAWLLASIDTRANGMFKQIRVGRYGRLFRVYKIRTMRPLSLANDDDESSVNDTTVTTANDRRITRLGTFWRRTKIDELPQLFNVLIGDMSFVGPRPDVPGFADKLEGEDRIVLEMRPGITGPATLKYRHEEELLASVPDPETYNRAVIFPDKVRLNKEYVKNWSFSKDVYYIWRTIWQIFARSKPPSLPSQPEQEA